ncbi:Copper chaperone SCO1/SenC [Rhabdaerophilaceae bacterium]
MNALKLVRLTAWGAIAAVTVALLYVLLNPRPPESQGIAAVGGPFRLTAHNGQMVSAEGLKGKPFALFFGFTHCPDVCPTSMLEITNDLNALGDSTKSFPVYFVTVDPARDTAELLKDYLGSFDPRIIGLIPRDEAELAAMTRTYRAIYRKVDTPSGYTMDHTASIYLMDAKGQFFGTLDSRETPETRQAKLRRLLERG